MNVTIFSAHEFEKNYISGSNGGKHNLQFLSVRLNAETAALATGSQAVVLFVNDDASGAVVKKLHEAGVRYIALRSAGYNNVDITEAKKLGMRVARVPAYSPYAVAEHAVALMLALNRRIIRANNRVHELNFSLDGLIGFDMNGKTVGIIGTGQIGRVVARIMHGFGCKVLAFDPVETEELKTKLNVQYVPIDELYKRSDIITLHVPLFPSTRYLINSESINQMKQGVMLINTSRGALVNTKDVINALKKGKIGYLGLDVYEDEAGLFFHDHSDDILQDEVISRLLSFKNVLITSHQGFLTDTALTNIADTTIFNLDCFANGSQSENEVSPS